MLRVGDRLDAQEPGCQAARDQCAARAENPINQQRRARRAPEAGQEDQQRPDEDRKGQRRGNAIDGVATDITGDHPVEAGLGEGEHAEHWHGGRERGKLPVGWPIVGTVAHGEGGPQRNRKHRYVA